MDVHIELGALTKSSAKIASFLVKMVDGKPGTYSYKNPRTGNNVTVHQFLTKLVGENPSFYCIGFVKGTEIEVAAAANMYKDDSVWTLSKVVFDSQARAAYIHTPLLFRVDLRKSTFEPHATDNAVDDALRQRMPEAPVPPRTVAETACINTARSTDLLAVVKEIKRERTSKTGKSIADVVLIDDSKTSSDKLATVVVSVFGTEKLKLLATKIGEPMSFFNLVVTCNDGNTEITHYEDDIVSTPPTCHKTTTLLEKTSLRKRFRHGAAHHELGSTKHRSGRLWVPAFVLRCVPGFHFGAADSRHARSGATTLDPPGGA